MKNTEESIALLDSNWTIRKSDVRFPSEIFEATLKNIFFDKPVGLKSKFIKCDFRYCTFSDGYFRLADFQDCDFTGSRFIRCNFEGANFDGCKFDYADFDKTQISSHVLDRCCPGPENLKLKFSRSLRVNYQGLGDAKAANKAINIELSATEEHLRKAWHSNETYYRRKYKKFDRLQKFLEWLSFKALDFLWGNGEKLSRLVRFALICVVSLASYSLWEAQAPLVWGQITDAFIEAWLIFISFAEPPHINKFWLSVIYSVRLIWFALLVSILVKRLGRR